MKKLFSEYKTIILFAVLLIVAVCAAVTAVRFVSQKEEPTDNNTVGYEVPADSENTLSGDSKILVVCRNEWNDGVIFMLLLDFRIYSDNIVLIPLAPDTLCGGRTYEEAYNYGGIKMLEEAIEDVRQISVDRYAVIDKNGFNKLTDSLGKITLNVTEDFTYQSSDKSYEVKAGENDLEAAMLYYYIKLVADKPDRLTDLLVTIINGYLETIDESDAESLFGRLCNCVDTDITINDYYSCSADIEYILTHDVKCASY